MYIMAIWSSVRQFLYKSWPFGTFVGYFPRFGKYFREKSGNLALLSIEILRSVLSPRETKAIRVFKCSQDEAGVQPCKSQSTKMDGVMRGTTAKANRRMSAHKQTEKKLKTGHSIRSTSSFSKSRDCTYIGLRVTRGPFLFSPLGANFDPQGRK
jgi:hypothetical protein